MIGFGTSAGPRKGLDRKGVVGGLTLAALLGPDGDHEGLNGMGGAKGETDSDECVGERFINWCAGRKRSRLVGIEEN